MSKATLLAILPSSIDPIYIIDTSTGQKIRIDSLNNGPISKIQMTNEGSGYASPPEVLISGGGGNGASAVAVVVNNKVIRIDILNKGENYTAAPNVTLSGGGGSGAQAICYLQDLNYKLSNGIYRGKYKRIELSYPRNVLLESDKWEIKSFNPRTREVCVAFIKNVSYSDVVGVCPRTDAQDTRPLYCPHGLESQQTIFSYTIPDTKSKMLL